MDSFVQNTYNLLYGNTYNLLHGIRKICCTEYVQSVVRNTYNLLYGIRTIVFEQSYCVGLVYFTVIATTNHHSKGDINCVLTSIFSSVHNSDRKMGVLMLYVHYQKHSCTVNFMVIAVQCCTIMYSLFSQSYNFSVMLRGRICTQPHLYNILYWYNIDKLYTSISAFFCIVHCCLDNTSVFLFFR